MNSKKDILFSKQQKNCKRTNNKWSWFKHKNSQNSYRKSPLKKIPRGIVRGQYMKNLDSYKENLILSWFDKYSLKRVNHMCIKKDVSCWIYHKS